MIREELLEKLENWENIREDYYKWEDLMEEKVNFSFRDSSKHSKDHSLRVLVYSLSIADSKNLPEEDRDILGMTSIFHDTRRKNDGFDTGHGQRAADYYKSFCDEEGMDFKKAAYDIMAYHDLDDSLGTAYFKDRGRDLLLYQIFKDADGLDRFRLASNGLNENFLRTHESHELIDYAKFLVRECLEVKKVKEKDKYLIVVDMQKDFIDGSLGTKEAKTIVPKVKEKILSYPGNVYFTMDTHDKDYLNSQEGKMLPVEHCIFGTEGWNLDPEISEAKEKRNGTIYQKKVFGSEKLVSDMKRINENEGIEEIELIGLCTDICVVSNAIMLKNALPQVKIKVDASCCAGVSPEKHEAALDTMESCQILVYNRDEN